MPEELYWLANLLSNETNDLLYSDWFKAADMTEAKKKAVQEFEKVFGARLRDVPTHVGSFVVIAAKGSPLDRSKRRTRI